MTVLPTFIQALFARLPGGKALSLEGRFVGGFAWQATSAIGTGALGFFFILCLGRALGPTQFGLFSLGAAVVAFCFQLFDLRLADSLIRFLSEFEAKQETEKGVHLVRILSLLNISSCVVAAFGCAFAGSWLYRRQLVSAGSSSYLVWSGVLGWAGLATNSLSLGVLRMRDQFRTLALINMSSAFLKLLAVLGLSRRPHLDALHVLWLTGTIGAGANVVQLLCAARHLHWPKSAAFGTGQHALRTDAARIRHFVARNYLFSIVGLPLKDLDSNLLGYFGSLAALGRYRFAKNVVMVLGTLADSAFYVCYPEIVRRRTASGADAVKHYVKSLSAAMGAVGVAMYGISVAAVPFVVSRWLGPAYSGTASYFAILAVGILVWTPLVWVNPTLLAFDRPGKAVLATICGSAVALALMAILIPTIGAYGAAIGTTAGGITGLLTGLAMVRHFVFKRLEQ